MSPALIHFQLLSDTQVRSTLHAQPVYPLPATLSSLCARFSARPVGNACDPGSCHNFHDTDVDRELEYAYRSKKVELRGKRMEQNRNPV